MNGCFAALAYSIVVAAAPLQPQACPVILLSPGTLPNAVVGSEYAQTISGSGGTPPYSFGVTAGSLPAALTLAMTGALSGTATTPGTSLFTMRGTDALGCFADRAFSVSSLMAVPTLPQAFGFLLALGLTAIGYRRLRNGKAQRT